MRKKKNKQQGLPSYETSVKAEIVHTAIDKILAYPIGNEKRPLLSMDFVTLPTDEAGAKKIIQEGKVRSILELIGEDISRQGLVDTPKRVVKSWGEIYKGYDVDPKDVLTLFDAEGADQMVLLRDIEIYSMCEHHMLPFYGKAHVAYIPDPNGKIIGVSKLARLVDIFARRLQIQERIGDQVTDFLMQELGCLGAACTIEATHMCMRMRGVGKQNSTMITSSVRGVFKDDPSARQEFLTLIK